VPSDLGWIAWLPFVVLLAIYGIYDWKAYLERRKRKFVARENQLFSQCVQIGGNILSSIDEEALSSLIVSECRQLLSGTTRLAFFTVDYEHKPEVIKVSASFGFDESKLEQFSFPLDRGSSVIGRALLTNEVQVIRDEASRYWCNKVFVESLHLERFVVIPFVLGDKPLGALLVENSENLPKQYLIEALDPLRYHIPLGLENRRLYKHVERISIHDELTGLYNYRFFKRRCEEEVSRCVRYGRKLSMAMLDIDHFKRFNDDFGHQVGDKALEITARVLKEATRTHSVVARYGGEEFVIIEAECDKMQFASAIERVRERIAEQIVPGEDGLPTRRLTVSAGIATLPDDGQDAESLIRAADYALLYSKRNGRDRITLAPVRLETNEHRGRSDEAIRPGADMGSSDS
jgi:diguanylate cyclase (GGDEF)-like protein